MSVRFSRRRLAAALTLGATLLLALAPVADPARAADNPDAPAIAVASFTPDVGVPGATLALTGTLRAGAEPLTSTVLRLRVSTRPVATRADLAALAAGTAVRADAAVYDEVVEPDLDAGSARSWSLRTPLDLVPLATAGVYPVTVALESRLTGERLAEVTTFLSWFPTGSIGSPTNIVWVVPLVGTPARDADGVFVDDRTAAALAPGGRLRTVLDSATGTSASWLVDPELLQAARDMADGYDVRREDGTIGPGGAAGEAAAQKFVTDARTGLAGAEVAATGYADPDVNALARADLGDDVTLATTTGGPLLAAELGRAVRTDLAAPPGGAVTRPALATLRAAGITNLVLSDLALPVDPTVPYTPTGLARVPSAGGAVTAALFDTALSGVVGAPSEQGGNAMARARYLAETLMITLQRPSDPRTVVVAPPRTWDVDAAFARSMILLPDQVPWLKASSLAALLDSPLPDAPRGSLTFPEGEQKAELSQAQIDGAAALGAGITTFTGVLKDPGLTATRYTAAMLRTESAAFRAQRAAGTALLDAVTANLDRDRSKVRVLSRGTVTLSGANGQVPITVANDLDQAVVVRVRLTPVSTVKLRVEQPGEIRLGPRKKETVEVAARAAAGGTVPVEVTLLTQTGAQYDEPVTIQVRSTAYSRVGLAIVGLATVALLALVAARLVRRVRRVRQGSA